MAKHIVFNQPGGSDVLRYVDFLPAEPAGDEVLVNNKAIAVNFIDTYIRSGLYPVKHFPSGLGTEAAGIVTAVGPHVKQIKVGDRVAYCQATQGAYAEQHLVAESKLVKLPAAISYEQAAAALMKGLTVSYLFKQTYHIQAGEKFLFHAAAGGVGLIACQWAKLIGAKLIGTASSSEKTALAKAAGAWAVIDYKKESVVEKIAVLTEGQKVNVVYDSVGQAMWLTSLDCLKPRGLMVSFGNSSGPVTGVDLGLLNQKGCLYVTRPSLFGYITNAEQLQTAANELFGYIAINAINVEVQESQKFPLKEAAKAHDLLTSRQTTGACLLIPD